MDLSVPLGDHFEDQFCLDPPGAPHHSSEILSLQFPQVGPQTHITTSCSGTPERAPPKQSFLQPMGIAIVGSGHVAPDLLGNTLVHTSGELSQVLVCLVQIYIIIPNFKEHNFF